MDEHAAGLGPASQWSLAQSASHSLCLSGQPTDNPLMRHNIATIMKSSMQKVPHLVVLIKSFVRSDADASVALRDPSGLCVSVCVCVCTSCVCSSVCMCVCGDVFLFITAGEIKGTIHGKVLDAYSTEELLPGSVLVLRQVCSYSFS